MAAPTILQVMQGIEARLATIGSLRVNDIVPDQINPKPGGGYAIVGVPPVDAYHATMGPGRFRLSPTVTVLVSSALDRIGQQNLAQFADPTGTYSIRAAIEADRTLGGVVDDCIVTGFQPFGRRDVGEVGYYGGEWSLQVVAIGG